MTPSVTSSIRMHGGTDRDGVPRFDFSTNSNACGPCPTVTAAVTAVDARFYPEGSYADLRVRLAEFHGVKPERVLMAASASEFIFRITAAAVQHGVCRVALPVHAYGDYAHAAQVHGLAASRHEGQGVLHWHCEPSSPLGGADDALQQATQAEDIHVLDCAYEPLRLAGAASLTAQQRDALWQFWTPNKAMGLTGVRAAYAIAPLDDNGLSARLEKLCPSWPVGAHGVAMLNAWTEMPAQQWLAAGRQTLAAWKARQLALCATMGWHCLPSDANFFCARPALQEGGQLAATLQLLRSRGIKLRDAASFGLPGYVRLSVQPPDAQDALHNAWQDITGATR